MYHLLADLLTY